MDPPFSPGAAPCPACGTSQSALCTFLSDFLCTKTFWTHSPWVLHKSLWLLAPGLPDAVAPPPGATEASSDIQAWSSPSLRPHSPAEIVDPKHYVCSHSKENSKYYFLSVIKEVPDKLPHAFKESWIFSGPYCPCFLWIPNLFACLNQVIWGTPACLPRKILPGSYSISYFLSDLSLVFLLFLSLILLNILSWSEPHFEYMYFLFPFMLTLFSRAQLFVTLWTTAHQAPLSMVSPGRNTGEGCYFLLQGIFLTQGCNPGLLWRPHCRQILYPWAISFPLGTTLFLSSPSQSQLVQCILYPMSEKAFSNLQNVALEYISCLGLWIY